MKNRLVWRTALAMVAAVSGLAAEGASVVTSPDGKVSVDVDVSDGAARYTVRREGQVVMGPSKLGVVREDADFTKGLGLVGSSGPAKGEDRYELATIKRRMNVYQFNKFTVNVANAQNAKMDVVFQVSNDGVAFRYLFPETSGEVKKIKAEGTTFKFAAGTKAWLQPMAVAKTGFERTNPSYEEYYQKGIEVGRPSTMGQGWVYPALFNSGENWVLVSEAGVGKNYCGTRLGHESQVEGGGGEYRVAFPDARETIEGQPVNPESTLPWATPWRVIVVGSLGTVVESTLGTDVAEPAKVAVEGGVKVGRASWSWPLLGDSKTNYETQKQFIDYAAEMGWEYCLIDALWDKQIGYEKVKELAAYAATKNVGVLLWYNSNGAWNGAPQTPKDRMHTHAARMEEFAKLKEMGVKGVKVDFFGGDGQSFMKLYQETLEDAAQFGILVNFHGCTLPRGWQRTYPNLVTMEAIRGLEFITFDQRNADQAPTHMAMLPFTRNVFDPMDFTPVALDKINNRIQRRTSSGFELATAVLFTSGIQHYAEVPEGMGRMPGFVREFLKGVPGSWEDVRFIEGYPGKYAVVARRGGGRWFVAGVNAEGEARTVRVDFGALGIQGNVKVIEDAEGAARFSEREVKAGEVIEVVLKSNGGFVAVGGTDK